jgi:hypothetical protein
VGFPLSGLDTLRIVVNFVYGNVLPLGEKSFGEFLYFLSGHSVGTSLSFEFFSKHFSQIAKYVCGVNVFLYFELKFCRLALVGDLLAFVKISIRIDRALIIVSRELIHETALIGEVSGP